MKTELLTVSKIFHESIFRIPDYQRGYSWEKQHLQDFWSDIEQLDLEKNHYTGVITLESVPESSWTSWNDDTWIIRSRRYTPYYVVDGQQRLTTISILIYCIISRCKELGISSINFTPISDVQRKYIFDTRQDELIRSYIFGYEKDNPSYEHLKTEIFDETSQSHHPDETTIYTRNLDNAKSFFMEKINSFTEDEINQTYSKVTQQLVFNAYEISKEIDVFVAFETMNNRGKPLSTLELLKNRLIYLAMQIGKDTEDGNLLRMRINDAWKTAYHFLGKNEKRPLDDDRFLEAHLFVYYFKNIETEFLSEDIQTFKRYLRTREITDNTSNFLLNRLFTRKRTTNNNFDIELPPVNQKLLNDYSSDLKVAVELYYKLSSPEISASKYKVDEVVWLERIGRLRGYEPNPLLLAIYSKERSAKKRIAFLEAYEKLLFIQTMRLGRTQDRDSGIYLSSESLKFISGKSNIETLHTWLSNNIDMATRDDNITEIISDWVKNGNGYYGWKAIRYFLFEYETSLMQTSKSERKKIDWDVFSKEDYDSEYISIEHIYPQRARDKYWTSKYQQFTTPQRKLLKNSLGNLLALSTPKNSSLGNKPFPEKVGNTKNTVGYCYGSYSENEVAQQENWGYIEILNRDLKMLEFLEKRWSINIGTKEQKIKCLGLAFLTTQL